MTREEVWVRAACASLASGCDVSVGTSVDCADELTEEWDERFGQAAEDRKIQRSWKNRVK